jgi:hypothetical protein
MLTIVLAAAVLQVPGSAEAKKENKENKENWEPGLPDYVDKHPKVTKDYYVVREGGGDQCKIVAGKFGDPPVGAIGSAPYAGKQYATAALKKFPECKGGEATEVEGEKPGKKLKARNREKNKIEI